MNTREGAALAVLTDWVSLVQPPGKVIPLPYWWLSGLLFVPIGYLAGEAARRALMASRMGTGDSTA